MNSVSFHAYKTGWKARLLVECAFRDGLTPYELFNVMLSSPAEAEADLSVIRRLEERVQVADMV